MGMSWLTVRFIGVDNFHQTVQFKLLEDTAKEILRDMCNGRPVLFQSGEKNVYINPQNVCMAQIFMIDDEKESKDDNKELENEKWISEKRRWRK